MAFIAILNAMEMTLVSNGGLSHSDQEKADAILMISHKHGDRDVH